MYFCEDNGFLCCLNRGLSRIAQMTRIIDFGIGKLSAKRTVFCLTAMSTLEFSKGGLFRELAGAINFKNIRRLVRKPFVPLSFKFDFHLISIQKS